MMFLALSVLLQAAPASLVRSVPVSVVDEKGAPVTGLAVEEVALLENGLVRDVTRLKADQRPLTVAVVVDSTQEISSEFRLFLVDAVTDFLKRLPEGTRYSLWVTGDRPQKIVDFTDDAAQGERALRRAIATGGNTLLDAIVLASREIREVRAKEDQRTAVVVVSGLTTSVANRNRYRSLEETQDNADTFLSIQFGEGGGSFRGPHQLRLRAGLPGQAQRRVSGNAGLGHGRGPDVAQGGRRAERAVPAQLRDAPGPQGAQARAAGGPAGSQGARRGRPELLRPMARGSVFAALLLVVSAASEAQAPAQTPKPPTFGVGIEVINLNVSVTDSQNRYVTDLVEKDFAVFEDGIRQELSLFTHENLPISLALLIDTSASMDEKLTVAQSAAIRFVKTLRPQDLAQVVQFNDRISVLQDYTADQATLEGAIRRTQASGPTALYNALYVTLKDLGGRKSVGELRRRAIVLLSDGEDTASLVNDEQVLELARQTEINIYAISIRPSRPADRDRLAFSQAVYVLTAARTGHGGPGPLPRLALRAGRRLRSHRGGAAHAVQPGLHLIEQASRRQVAADRGARPRAGGPPDPPQARLLRSSELSRGVLRRTPLTPRSRA
jgi:VWFA-related protein